MTAQAILLKPTHPGSLLVTIEGGALAWVAARPLWETIHPAVGIVAGVVAFLAYAGLYLVPNVNIVMSICVSFPWAVLTGYVATTQFNADHFDRWAAGILAFFISAAAHWTLSESN
ncbi:MAG TPA: hypothetical protein VKQ54_11215 [Caulobacteraceae bacterium]|nr:hypothetical protein [Caulobacteraceae bacterium]